MVRNTFKSLSRLALDKTSKWATEMAQLIKALVPSPDGLISGPKTHMIEDKTDANKLSFDLHKYVIAHTHTSCHMCTPKQAHMNVF